MNRLLQEIRELRCELDKTKMDRKSSWRMTDKV